MYIVLYLRLWGSLRSLRVQCQAVGKLQTHNNHVCSLPSDKPVNKARLTHHSGSLTTLTVGLTTLTSQAVGKSYKDATSVFVADLTTLTVGLGL